MTYPFLISIPHCGSRVPAEIRSLMALADEEIYDAKDLGSDVLFDTLPARQVIEAEYSRLVVDLNRDPENLGPKGVVAKTDYRGREIYLPGRYPDASSIKQRVRDYHAPYHEKIQKSLADPEIKGLFDCHSLNGTAPVDAPDAGQKRKDIILSNNGNSEGGPDPKLGEPTASRETIQAVKTAFEAAGFSVAINRPYQGGFITVRYGRQLLKQGRFAIQIEMNQDLYLGATSLDLDPEKIRSVRDRIFSAFESIKKLC